MAVSMTASPGSMGRRVLPAPLTLGVPPQAPREGTAGNAQDGAAARPVPPPRRGLQRGERPSGGEETAGLSARPAAFSGPHGSLFAVPMSTRAGQRLGLVHREGSALWQNPDVRPQLGASNARRNSEVVQRGEGVRLRHP